MSKKSNPLLYNEMLYKNGQDFFDTQYDLDKACEHKHKYV